jgi:hypothetical protein
VLPIWLISILAALRLASSPWPMNLLPTMPITTPISTSTTRISISVMPRWRDPPLLHIISLQPVHGRSYCLWR